MLDNMPAALFRPIPLGITKLDTIFGGGAHPQDLLLLAGKQNIGKTIMVVQFARNMARWAKENGHPLVPFVACYEHDEWTLHTRLLCMESWHVDPENPLSYDQVIEAIVKVKTEQPDAHDVLTKIMDYLPPVAIKANTRIAGYSTHMILYRASRVYTTVETIKEIMDYYRKEYGLYLLPILDYLQAIPPTSSLKGKEFEDPDIVRGYNLGLLKDLANDYHVPVIAVAAVEKEALSREGPIHVEDVLGPEVSTYTPDCALVLNRDLIEVKKDRDKRNTFIRLSVEKNRRGPSELEWRHEILGGSFFIDPDGVDVQAADSFQKSRFRMEIDEADHSK